MAEQIKVVSFESGECEEMIIVTDGQNEKNEWIMQTTEGRFDTCIGCLQFLNGEEFDEDELTEIEKLHYEAANDCFNENASKIYEDKKSDKQNKADEYFYAESKGFSVTEDIYEGGFLRYEKDSQPYCDLFRFSTEDERDTFIENGEQKNKISAEDALEHHKDQFNYWENK